MTYLEDGKVELRLSPTKTTYGWKDNLLVTHVPRRHSPVPQTGPRVLVDDVVRVWGRCQGIYEYETVLGSTLQVPYVVSRALEIV